jgi:carbamoyltransferase
MASIYSFYAGSHSAVASLIIDGKIHTIIEEERLTRIKSGDCFLSYPDNASKKIEEISGLKIKDADYRIATLPAPDAYYRKLLKTNYEKCSHHDAHNYGCYFTSGFEGKVLSISYDGGGETSLMKVFLCEDGKMSQVLNGKLSDFGSLPHIWGFFVTNMMVDEYGNRKWKMCKDEGKLVGMAPDGKFDEKIYRILNSLMRYENLHFDGNPSQWRTNFVARQMQSLGYFSDLEKRQNFSYTLQYFTEEIFLNFLNDLNRLYPDYKKLCLSGGLFANVKLNQKINELDWVDEIFIHPAMGDEGLALGSGIKKAVELGDIKLPFKLQNASFGVNYDNDYIQSVSTSYDFEKIPYEANYVAKKIDEGKIIGWFKGKFEYGPRALGNRSIIVKATEKETHQKLNQRLGRYEIMPFAPSILYENFEDVFGNPKSIYSAQFMTICYSTKEDWIEKIPSVLQKTDKTARPQVVSKTFNSDYYDLIYEYYKISGIPLVLNTSFNLHNEPIIDNPQQAFECLNKGVIDELVIEDYVYRNKQ